jgi:hypothetical protein
LAPGGGLQVGGQGFNFGLDELFDLNPGSLLFD